MSQQSHPYYKPLQIVPDAEDVALHQINLDHRKGTTRLRELVPLLNFTNGVILKAQPDETVIEIPLLEQAMNQNGTHQASVFYLLADYVAGSAMFAALPGVYVTGVHDRCHGYPVQYWLKSGSVDHLVPAIKSIRGVGSVGEDDAQRMRRELIETGVTEVDVNVQIFEGSRLVATATHTMGMYGDLPRLDGQKANMFQNHNACLSANMIAGLKSDELSRKISNGLGSALANRMTYSSPELPDIITAREMSLASLYRTLAPGTQVVVLGLGLDTAPNRHSEFLWYGLDLRAGIKQRKLIFQEHQISDTGVVKIACDLRVDDWVDKLLNNGYDQQRDTVFVIEGLSMYLSKQHLRRCLARVAEMPGDARKTVWIDHVTPEVFSSDNASVAGFLDNMSRLGEPFISGYENVENLLDQTCVQASARESAQQVLSSTNNLHELYVFSTVSLASP